MGDRTSIEWTRGDDGSPGATWNPVTGCTKVSAGCDHCYAETFAERWRGTPGHYFENGFDVQLRPDKLELPLRWTRPRRIFVNSMSDLFHDQVPDEYIARVFAVMALAPQHTFQVLTKRHARMRSLLSSDRWQELYQEAWMHEPGPDGDGDPYVAPSLPLSNVWLGVSAENQQWADIRIPALLDTPAAVRWVSAEPLLGPLDLRRFLDRDDAKYDVPALNWVVTGGESGRAARPAHPDWFRSIRDQCQAAGVAFLHKQNGEWVPESRCLHGANAPAAFLSTNGTVRHLINGKPAAPPMSRGQDITIRRVGKKAAGRLLDGREHNGYPPTPTGTTTAQTGR